MTHLTPFSIDCSRKRVRLLPFLVSAAFIIVIVMLVTPEDKRDTSRRGRVVVLYAFSIMQGVMDYAIIPAFRDYWAQATGESVEFATTYAGSGAITNQIVRRIQPEIAVLCSEMDATRLREHGVLMIPSREFLPHKGIISRSPVVIVVRTGNPKSVQGFMDLTQKDVRVVQTDPETSGSAQWATVAAFDVFATSTRNRDRAFGMLTAMWTNVMIRAPDAHPARAAVEDGRGDVLITYEAETVATPRRPRIVGDVIYPHRSLMTEHVVMIIDKNIQPEQRRLVLSFLEFLWSDTAQRFFTEYGFRSVLDHLNQEKPTPCDTCTFRVLDDLGGARRVQEEILSKAWTGMSIIGVESE